MCDFLRTIEMSFSAASMAPPPVWRIKSTFFPAGMLCRKSNVRHGISVARTQRVKAPALPPSQGLNQVSWPDAVWTAFVAQESRVD